MRTQLLCRVRPGHTLTFDLRGEDSVLGRDPAIAVSVPLEGVSRRHARIRFDGASHWLEDMKSTNGTFLNGEAVVRERLKHLDVITLGKQAELIFVMRGGDFETVKKTGIARAMLIRDTPGALAQEIALGELTLGRAVACNVVAESGAISKLHARILRTAEELTIEDLGSSNGTYVNGTRVLTSVLRNGDVISLAGVEPYRVVVETGEVSVRSGAYKIPDFAPPLPSAERPSFSKEWKTRFEWDSSENVAIADVRRAAQERLEARAAGPLAGPAPVLLKPSQRAAAVTGARPAVQAKPAPAAAPAKPAPAAPPAKPAPPKPAAPAAAAPSAPVAPKPAAPPPKPAPPAAPPAAAPPPAPAPPAPAQARPILEVSLAGSGFALTLAEPGAQTIGRAKESGLRIDHATVSRGHARVTLSQDRTKLTLEDLGGANGTFLNGVKIAGVQPLVSGDTITLGEVTLTVTLREG